MAVNSGLTRKCERCGGALPSDGQCPSCDTYDDKPTDANMAQKMDGIFSMAGKDNNAPRSQPLSGAALVMRGSNQRFPLTQSVSKIGRDQTNSIPLPKDSYISRHHAWVLYIKGSYWVEDLGSTNGTLLNGEVLNERKQIFPGDCLKLGRTELIFEMN